MMPTSKAEMGSWATPRPGGNPVIDLEFSPKGGMALVITGGSRSEYEDYQDREVYDIFDIMSYEKGAFKLVQRITNDTLRKIIWSNSGDEALIVGRQSVWRYDEGGVTRLIGPIYYPDAAWSHEKDIAIIWGHSSQDYQAHQYVVYRYENEGVAPLSWNNMAIQSVHWYPKGDWAFVLVYENEKDYLYKYEDSTKDFSKSDVPGSEKYSIDTWSWSPSGNVALFTGDSMGGYWSGQEVIGHYNGSDINEIVGFSWWLDDDVVAWDPARQDHALIASGMDGLAEYENGTIEMVETGVSDPASSVAYERTGDHAIILAEGWSTSTVLKYEDGEVSIYNYQPPFELDTIKFDPTGTEALLLDLGMGGTPQVIRFSDPGFAPVLDIMTYQPFTNIEEGFDDGYLVTSYHDAGQETVFKFDGDGLEPVANAPNDGFDDIRPSADGSEYLLSGRSLYSYKKEGFRNLSSSGKGYFKTSWSPKSHLALIITDDPGSKTNTRVLSYDGQKTTVVLNESSFIDDINWRPGYDQAYFKKMALGDLEDAKLMRYEAGAVTEECTIGLWDAVSWHPSGTYAIISNEEGLKRFEPGKCITKTITEKEHVTRFSWDPTGSYGLFISQKTLKHDVPSDVIRDYLYRFSDDAFEEIGVMEDDYYQIEWQEGGGTAFIYERSWGALAYLYTDANRGVKMMSPVSVNGYNDGEWSGDGGKFYLVGGWGSVIEYSFGGGAPPVITKLVPPDPQVTVSGIEMFDVEASDPEGDPVNVRWTLDGKPFGAGRSISVDGDALGDGHHELVALVSDGANTTSHEWVVTKASKKDAPTILPVPSFEAVLIIIAMSTISALRLRRGYHGL